MMHHFNQNSVHLVVVGIISIILGDGNNSVEIVGVPWEVLALRDSLLL